jgi:hypothetical protein
MTTENYFGQKISFTFDNYNRLFDYATLKLSGIPAENLCTNYELALIKNIGFDLDLIMFDGSCWRLDSSKYNTFSNVERIISHELCITNEDVNNDLNNIKLPLFTLDYLKCKNYFAGINEAINNGSIMKYSITLFIEFCTPDDIIILKANEELKLSDIKLQFQFENATQDKIDLITESWAANNLTCDAFNTTLNDSTREGV